MPAHTRLEARPALVALLAGAAALLVAVSVHIPGLAELALAWLPALLLAASLLLGHHPGAELLIRLRAGRARPPRARVAAPVPRRPAPVRRTSGGLLLARSLASRPPPAPALAQSQDR